MATLALSMHCMPILLSDAVINTAKNPSVSFFLGTQITLANPVCLMAYVWASWRFFSDRIHDEEITLIYFFGDDYLAYQKNVTTVGVPFVKGFEFTPEKPEDS